MVSFLYEFFRPSISDSQSFLHFLHKRFLFKGSFIMIRDKRVQVLKN